MRLAKVVLPVLVVVGLAFATFFAVRAFRDGSPAEAELPPGPVHPGRELFREERLKPRFQGELLGIFIAPRAVAVPDKFLTFEEICGPDALTARVPDERAGQFDLKVQLPPEYVFQPESMNTGVIACAPQDQMEIRGPENLRLKDPEGGVVYAARWDYAVTPYTGAPAGVSIDRGLFKYTTFDAAVDRVKVITVGGRQAVLIEPITPDGVSSASLVVFPEPFGTTWIAAADLPLSDLLEVAEIVAKATQ